MTKTPLTSLLVFLTIGPVLVGIAEAKPSARRTVRSAQHLYREADSWARYSRRRGYPNTAAKLRAIADLAGDVERAARRGRLSDAESAINEIVDTVIDMRDHVGAIPSYRDRYGIKRDMNSAINELGSEVFEGNWIQVAAAARENATDADREGIEDMKLESLKRTRVESDSFNNDLDSGGSPPEDPGSNRGDGGFDP